MAKISPEFDGYAFTDANLVVRAMNSEMTYEVRPRKAVLADGAATPEGTLAGRVFRMTGHINGTDSTTAREYVQDLMANLRGADRVKKGMLNPYGDGSWWAQLSGRPALEWVPSDDSVRVSLEFHCEDPYRRKNTISSVNLTPSGGDTDVDLVFGTDQHFLGDAPRMPLTINVGGGWSAGDVVRIYNSTAGWRFEKTVVNAHTASQDLIIDGEEGKVYELGTQEVSEGVACTAYPYIIGGQTNVFDFVGTTTYQLATFEFWDRFFE